MANTISIEEEDFIIAENRHDEILKSLKLIATNLSNKDDKKDDTEIINAIKKQGENIEKAIEKMPAPEVNVVNDYKEIVSLLKENREGQKAMEKAFLEQKQAFENRLLPDTFTLVKTYGGATESVKVNYKESSKITIKK